MPPLLPVLIKMCKSSSLLLQGDQSPSQETGSGKVTESGNSLLLFLDIPCTKKEWKVTANNRCIFTEWIHKETIFQNRDSQVGKTVDGEQQLGCFHRFQRCIPSRSDTSSVQKVSSVRLRRSNIPVHSLTSWNVAKSVDIYQADECYSSASASTYHLSLSIPRRLATVIKDLIHN